MHDGQDRLEERDERIQHIAALRLELGERGELRRSLQGHPWSFLLMAG
jgi:hypothetical protein